MVRGDFELFTKRMIPLVRTPSVTIQKRGIMSMNAAAHAALGSPEAVELLFDRTHHVVMIRAVDRTEPHAYALRGIGAETSGTFVLSATAFAKYYDIDTAVSRRYVAEIEDGAMYVNLDGDFAEVTSNRSPKPAEEAPSGTS